MNGARYSYSASKMAKRAPRPRLTADELSELQRNVSKTRSAIGAEVRAARQRLNLTQAEFAEKVGLSTGMISKIEHGNVAASVEALVKIAHLSGLNFAKLFSGMQETKSCHYMPAESRLVVDREGSGHNFVHYLMGHWFTDQGLSELYLVSANDNAKPYFFRKSGLVFLHMLTGMIQYRHGNDVFKLAPGDSLYFDATSLNGPDLIVEYPVSFLLWRQTPGAPMLPSRRRVKSK